eukprot:scaffold117803_cov36-Phaeocystis_antarctica.AAC.1
MHLAAQRRISRFGLRTRPRRLVRRPPLRRRLHLVRGRGRGRARARVRAKARARARARARGRARVRPSPPRPPGRASPRRSLPPPGVRG